MALGFLNVLEIGARIVRPFIQLGVTLGRNLAEIGAALARGGARVEAASLRRVYEAERAEREASGAIVTGDTTRVPDPSEYPEAVTKQRRQFAWRVRAQYIDVNSGRELTRYLQISSDGNLSPAQVINSAQQELEQEYGIVLGVQTKLEIVSATRAGPDQRL